MALQAIFFSMPKCEGAEMLLVSEVDRPVFALSVHCEHSTLGPFLAVFRKITMIDY